MKRAYSSSQYAKPRKRYCGENYPGEAEDIFGKAETYYWEFMKDILRCYTDIDLLPCGRDGGNRRVFDEESVDWMQGIMCLKGCGASIEDIQAYCRLCMLEESEENLRARYEIILKQPPTAHDRRMR